jgi:hypothetical protein
MAVAFNLTVQPSDEEGEGGRLLDIHVAVTISPEDAAGLIELLTPAVSKTVKKRSLRR